MRPKFALLLLPAASAFMIARAHAGSDEPASPPANERTSESPPPGAVSVPGQLSKLFKINDANPEADVPTSKQRIGNPLEFGYYLQDILARAEAATKRNDLDGAIKYYRALSAAVPEQATGWSLLCETYQKAGDRERALRACRYALQRRDVELKDYHRTVDLILARPGDLTAEERAELKALLAHLDTQADLAVQTAHLRCQVAIKTNDTGAMQACTAVLAKAAPNDPKTIVFQWSFAVMRGDRSEAAALLARAEKAGVAPESIERMSRVETPARRFTRGLGVAVASAAALLLALLLFVRLRRRVGTPDRVAS